MASILTADLPSDDEQDDDFDPSKDTGGSDTEKKKRSLASKRLRQGGPLASRIRDAELSEEVCEEQETAFFCCGASSRWTCRLTLFRHVRPRSAAALTILGSLGGTSSLSLPLHRALSTVRETLRQLWLCRTWLLSPTLARQQRRPRWTRSGLA